jgi:hypothetical protein
MRSWIWVGLVCMASLHAFAQPDLRHLRGVHATSNYGANVQGFRKAVFASPAAITADSVSVNIVRSVSSLGTWDTANVVLTGVTVGTSPKLASAGFWLSSNPATGELSLAFNPSMDPSLAPVSGFAGDVNLPRTGNGQDIFLDQVSRASGLAFQYVVAVAAHASQLVAAASNVQASNGATLDLAAVMQDLDAIKASIAAKEGAKSRYFDFLKAENVEWIAVTVPIFTDSLADPTVRLKYRPAGDTSGEPYTFDDADLQDFIVQAKQNGFKVSLGFEFYPVVMAVDASSPGCGTPQYKPNRWLLGQPVVDPKIADQACINPADWWWNPSHPSYAANVAAFWSSYTQIAADYAALAQQSGVDLFVLATEEDNLFRTRSAAAPYTNNFLPELTAMVSAVRAQYTGLVTYERHWTTFAHPDWFANGAGTAAAFESVVTDLALDVVGVSAYFPLTSSQPTSVVSVADFETAWDKVFTQYLLPLQAGNPGKPIVFSEWGYTNDLASPYVQGARLGQPMQPAPLGADGISQQANIIQAFFNVNARYGDLVHGSFLYGVSMQDPNDCQQVIFGIDCKPGSSQALADAYAKWLRSDANRVFDWAQNTYPQYFPGTAPTGSALGYLYRHYDATGNYLGVRDGRLYVHNGRDWNFLDVGSFRSYLDGVGRLGY